MTHELQSTLEACEIVWPALRNHIPCMAHVRQMPLSAFMSGPGVTGHTKYCEAHERDQRFAENETIGIGKNQWLLKEGNDRIEWVSAMRPGLAKIIQKVRISWYFESPEFDVHIAGNACGIHYADTWLSKQVHQVSKSHIPHHCTSDDGYEDPLERYTGGARAHLPIMGLYTRVASKSKIQLLQVTLYNTT